MLKLCKCISDPLFIIRCIQTMKRPRSGTILPSTPSSPPLTSRTTISLSLKSSQRPTPTPSSKRSLKFHNTTSSYEPENPQWKPLGMCKRELNLDLTFPTGQTFRWVRTGPSQYTGAVGHHLFTLLQSHDEVMYCLHNPCGDGNDNDGGDGDGDGDDDGDALRALKDYVNHGISLEKMWAGFAAADLRFRAVAPHMEGARLLRQDPLECLFQFVCSSNNHIARITNMVGVLSGFGRGLGNAHGVQFHAWPSLEELSSVDEASLRQAGFGYRAKYIVGAVAFLNSKPGGGKEWLLSLRNSSLEEAIGSLCTLPGVGPKVAACIALFSLDQHHAVPVDTHVWQIATKYITPKLSGERLTLKLADTVSKAFVDRFGRYAGWAQTVLFIAELSSQQSILPEELRVIKEKKNKTRKKKQPLPTAED